MVSELENMRNLLNLIRAGGSEVPLPEYIDARLELGLADHKEEADPRFRQNAILPYRLVLDFTGHNGAPPEHKEDPLKAIYKAAEEHPKRALNSSLSWNALKALPNVPPYKKSTLAAVLQDEVDKLEGVDFIKLTETIA